MVSDAATYANGSFDPKSFAQRPNDCLLCLAPPGREILEHNILDHLFQVIY
jgi:hypothetical protein